MRSNCYALPERTFDSREKSILNDIWVEQEFYVGSYEKRMSWAWERFCKAVKYETRYLFLHKNDIFDIDWEITPANFLFELASYLNESFDGSQLIRRIDHKTEIFRVRLGDEKYYSVSELGTVPEEYAVYPNRMSPAGIPMFYGAFDPETSILETIDHSYEKKYASIGTFFPIRSLTLLDLDHLPEIPSVFDEQKRQMIHPLRFFQGFASDISKSVSHDGREHIEYVPTQIVTEFFRRVYKTSDSEKLDGIIYKSSRDKLKSCCVLFCDNRQCAAAKDAIHERHILKLTSVEHRVFNDK